MCKNKNLVILTASFPYEPGEGFLENEICFWENTCFDQVYILPCNTKGIPRDIPINIKVLHLKQNEKKLIYIFKSLLSSLFYKESLRVVKNIESKGLKKIFFELYFGFKLTAVTLRERDGIYRTIGKISGDVYVYSYWNSTSSYAAVLLKKQGFVKKVFSRIHGYDIYHDQNPKNIVPLKEVLINQFDKVFALAPGAIEYLKNEYSASTNVLEVARLGVDIPKTDIVNSNEGNKIKILSVSSCIELKQISLMIEAFEILLSRNGELIIDWVHFGDGDELGSLVAQSKSLKDKFPSFFYEFKGFVPNKKVIAYLSGNKFDVFLNASRSEGVPVSIMEAMSFGIPVVAPDVGEIKDIVNSSNGVLLARNFTPEKIADAIVDIFFGNTLDKKIAARNTVEEKFDMKKNYKNFVARICELSEITP